MDLKQKVSACIFNNDISSVRSLSNFSIDTVNVCEPIFITCQTVEMAECLLKLGADPNFYDPKINPDGPPCFAVNNLDILQLLIQNGADVTRLNSSGETILHGYCRWGCFEIVKYLLENFNLDVNSQDKKGNTCLHKSLSNPKIVQLLLEHNANPYLVNKRGNTVFDCIYRVYCAYNKVSIVSFNILEEFRKNGKLPFCKL